MFRDRLKQLRWLYGYTQEQLADKIGVERSSIGKYEGKSGILPSIDVICKIADCFTVSVDYLLGRTDTPEIADKIAEKLGILNKQRTLDEEGVYQRLQSDEDFRNVIVKIYALPDDVRANFVDIANAIISRRDNNKK